MMPQKNGSKKSKLFANALIIDHRLNRLWINKFLVRMVNLSTNLTIPNCQNFQIFTIDNEKKMFQNEFAKSVKNARIYWIELKVTKKEINPKTTLDQNEMNEINGQIICNEQSVREMLLILRPFRPADKIQLNRVKTKKRHIKSVYFVLFVACLLYGCS